MIKHLRMFFIGPICALAVYGCASNGSSSKSGWSTLFDGKTLDQWAQLGNANWRVEDGAVVGDKGSGFLVSARSYVDFQLRVEFWVDAPANSGIFIRCSDPKAVTASNAYEVNIFDQRPDPSFGTGAIVNVAKVSPMPKAGGKWNTYEIVAKGSTFTVTLNGVKTVDAAHDSQHPAGAVALQYGSGTVKFRKVQIKAL